MEFLESLNEIYAKEKVWREMKDHYGMSKDKVLKLQNFLDKEVCDYLLSGLSSGKKVNAPNKGSFEELDVSGLKELFESKDFLDFLGNVIGKKIASIDLRARRFGWKDYDILEDSKDNVSEGFFFFLSKDWDESYGGQKVYVGGGEPLMCPVENNVFYVFGDREDSRSFV